MQTKDCDLGEDSDTETKGSDVDKPAKRSASRKGKGNAAKETASKEKRNTKTRATPSTKLRKGKGGSQNNAPTLQISASGAPSQAAASAPSPIVPQTIFIRPPMPTSLNQLPCSIADLDRVLPSFNAVLAVDTVEEDEENEIAKLALAQPQDMVKYVEVSLDILNKHRSAITKDDAGAVVAHIEARKEALEWYLANYIRLRPVVQSAPRDPVVPLPAVTLSADQFDPQLIDAMDLDYEAVVPPGKIMLS